MGARLQLRSDDARAALAYAADLSNCREAQQLVEQIGALPSLVGAEAVIVSACENWGTTITLDVGDRRIYSPPLMEAIARGWHEHPVLTRDLARPIEGASRTSDFVRQREWRRAGLFNDFYRPLGMTRELAGQLSWGPTGSSCCVVLHRGGSEFSARDHALLELLVPHLCSARRRVLDEASRERRAATVPSAAALARMLPITPREAEILERLATGDTNDAIAHGLGISRHTVVRHVEHLYTKLGVHSRVAATRVALRTAADGCV
jgi:DNA-binding CsgD family transcriptional regulator